MASRSHLLDQPCVEGPREAAPGTTAVVVGGGIAGVAAAVVLAERGVSVTLVERERYLGGRAGAWTDRLSDGESFEMERGFHAFFRQYYNLRALLRRIDPELGLLRRLEDYPILGPNGAVQSFHGLPNRTPWNILALVARSSAIGARDLLSVNGRRALEMLTFDIERTYGRRDGMSAAAYLDSLRFPPQGRRLLFDVFSHSFFNPEEEMSAAELLMMFHFYFTGNPEGLVFDVARSPFSTSIWMPFAKYLKELGVRIRCGEAASRVERAKVAGWRVHAADETLEADGVVLAVTVPALQDIVAGSPDLDNADWRQSVDALALTSPFAIWRLWLDRPTDRGRHPFVGTTGMGVIDNISLYHLFEDESRAWAEKHGGAVVELHAYAVQEGTDPEAVRADLLEGLHSLYPETRNAHILEERFFERQDCPAFAPGSHEARPGVDTPFDGITLAGDMLKLPIPSALMERAAASGFLAANRLLARQGIRPEPIRSIAPNGILARTPH